MRRRLLVALVYGGGALAAAALWGLLLFHSIYEDPRQEQVTVCLFLLAAIALGTWYGPERRITEEQDLAWLGAMLEWGLVLLHLPLLPWALLQGPLPIGLTAAIAPLLAWAAARFLSGLLPRRLRYRPVHALMLVAAGALAMQGYLVRADNPPYCRDLPEGRAGRSLFSFDDCLTRENPEGLCRIPGAEIAQLAVTPDGRHLVGTAVHEQESGLFRVDIGAPEHLEFITLGGLKPRSLVPRDNGRVFLVITEGPHNRLFWIEADPFRVLQAAALTASGEELQTGPVLDLHPERLLLMPPGDARVVEIDLPTWKTISREAPAVGAGIGAPGDAATDPALKRLFLIRPLHPYLQVLTLPELMPEQDLPLGFGASRLTIDRLHNRLYATRYLWGDAVVLDTDQLVDRGTLPMGFSVSRLALSPDRLTLAGLGFATGEVMLTSLSSGRPVRRWGVGRFASGLTWSETTGNVYAASRCGVYELEPRQ